MAVCLRILSPSPKLLQQVWQPVVCIPGISYPKMNILIAPGVYLFSVENKADSKIKVGKFVIVK
jgi:hypothetical protein